MTEIQEDTSIGKALNLLEKFSELYQTEEQKLPYHINLLDELGANETKHSKILGKLLQQKKGDKFEILERFLSYLKEKESKDINQEDTITRFSEIQLRNPQILVEKNNIDILIKDKDYAIIIENKVHGAVDQYKQLERYIDIVKKVNGYKEENIFVLYLPGGNYKDPEDQSWGKYFKKDIYNYQYLKITFKVDLLPWLKNKVLPEIKLKDKYLISAIQQYTDHLESLFNLREENKNMNMEIEKKLKEEMGITNENSLANLKEIEAKKQEVIRLLNYLISLEDNTRNKFRLASFKKWKENLSHDYSKRQVKIVDNLESDDLEYFNFGVLITNKDQQYSILAQFSLSETNPYIGLSSYYTNGFIENLEIINKIEINKFYKEENSSTWYYSRYCTFEELYDEFKKLIDVVMDHESNLQ